MKFNKFFKFFGLATSAAICAAPVTACSKTVYKVSDVKFVQEYAYVPNNESRDLSGLVKIEPENASNKQLKWEIIEESREDLATIDETTGVVTAGSSTGSAKIRCTSVDEPSKTSEQTIIIGQYIALQDFSVESINLIYKAPPKEPVMHFYPADATIAKKQGNKAKVEIADTSIAEYDETTGMITPKSVGNTICTITPYDYDADAKEFIPKERLQQPVPLVVSYATPQSITLPQATITLSAGETFDHLPYTVNPAGASQEVVWKVLDPFHTGTTVDGKGAITAGTNTGLLNVSSAWIYCYTPKHEVTVAIEVFILKTRIAIETISINNAPTTLTVDKTWTPDITVTPSNHTESYYINIPDDSKDYITCSNGVITGIRAGNATVEVRSVSQQVIQTASFKVVDEAASVTGVKIPSTLNVASSKIGEELADPIIPVVSPSNATNQNIVWTSSDTDVVEIHTYTETGNKAFITVKQTPTENVYIRATSEDNPQKFCDCTINVVPEQPHLTLSWDLVEGASVKRNETLTINATIQEFGKTETASWPVIWEVANKKILRIETGDYPYTTATCYPLATGTTQISAHLFGMSVHIEGTITVNYSDITDFNITFNQEATTELGLLIGDKVKLEASISPATACPDVTWWSNNPVAVSVDSTGLVTANEFGQATIFCYPNANPSLVKSVYVSVLRERIHVKSIACDKTYLYLIQGENQGRLEITFNPWFADNTAFTVTPSKPDIVECWIQDRQVIINPKSQGKTILTIQSVDNPLATCSCEVVVSTTHVNEIIIYKPPKYVYLNAPGTQIEFLVRPVTAPNKKVEWLSSNDKQAYVKDGYLYGVGLTTTTGPVTIICRSIDSPNVTAKFEVEVRENISYKKFSDDSWKNICETADQKGLQGLYDRYYLDRQHNPIVSNSLIGYERSLIIGKNTFKVRVIGENHDLIAAGDKKGSKAPLTFELCAPYSIIQGGQSANSKWSAPKDKFNYFNSVLKHNLNGGKQQSWKTSALSTVLDDPQNADLKNSVKLVTKSVAEGDDFKIQSYNDKFFPLTYTEMFSKKDTTGRVAEGEGTTYEFYANPAMTEEEKTKYRIRKTMDGYYINYWLASPCKKQSSYTTVATCIDQTGALNDARVDNELGVIFAFCI